MTNQFQFHRHRKFRVENPEIEVVQKKEEMREIFGHAEVAQDLKAHLVVAQIQGIEGDHHQERDVDHLVMAVDIREVAQDHLALIDLTLFFQLNLDCRH
jgi:hypothetical protein